MLYLFLSLIALGVFSALYAIVTNRNREESPVVQADSCATCNGENDKCEQECMMEAATKPIEYFDDEELDAFKGRSSDSYTDEEVEQFSYVLNTMPQEEIRDWCRSLHLRGIEIPDQLKDEVYMMMG
ncbi:MAG: hypothetical protein II407_04965 [Prevotella sp.]|jgi:hypothetical protein|nr:hypothetical protein [Prevotella sp.]